MELLKLYSKEKTDIFCLIKLLFIKVRCQINVNVSLEAILEGKGCVKIENWGTSVYFVLRFQENSMQNLSCFLVIKGILRGKDIH